MKLVIGYLSLMQRPQHRVGIERLTIEEPITSNNFSTDSFPFILPWASFILNLDAT